MVSDVTKEEHDRFTILLPIKIALSIFEGSSVSSQTFFARLLPWSARDFILILLTVVKAVSADEKKELNINNITTIISPNVALNLNYPPKKIKTL